MGEKGLGERERKGKVWRLIKMEGIGGGEDQGIEGGREIIFFYHNGGSSVIGRGTRGGSRVCRMERESKRKDGEKDERGIDGKEMGGKSWRECTTRKKCMNLL